MTRPPELAPAVAVLAGVVAVATGTSWSLHAMAPAVVDGVFVGALLIGAGAIIARPWRWLAAVAVVLLGLAVWGSDLRPLVSEYCTVDQPAGRYQVVVFRRPVLWSGFGQGGDAPGYVQLRERGGRVLCEGPIEMVQLGREVEWATGSVHIGPHGDGGANYEWLLP